jgi:hypothetical protein
MSSMPQVASQKVSHLKRLSKQGRHSSVSETKPPFAVYDNKSNIYLNNDWMILSGATEWDSLRQCVLVRFFGGAAVLRLKEVQREGQDHRERGGLPGAAGPGGGPLHRGAALGLQLVQHLRGGGGVEIGLLFRVLGF